MTPAKIPQPIPSLALTAANAAAALDMGVTAFRKYVAPEIKAVRCGGLVLYPVAELTRWLDEHAARVLEAA